MRCIALALFLAASASPCVAQVAGSFHATGEGCPDASLLYELFPTGTFDLSGTPSLDWIPNGGLGYVVTRGLSQFLPTTGGVNLALTDDAVSPPAPLGFAFAYPTGLRGTTQIEVSSNGYVYLEPRTINNSRCCEATARILRSFRNDTPSWAVLGLDLDPSAGGVVWFNTAPGMAWVTWDQVPEAGSGLLNTFQIQFNASGMVSMIWTAAGNASQAALVGWSGGGGVDDDGSFDLSASPVHDMGTSSGPLTISAPLARIPTIGQSFRIDLGNVPTNALVGGLLSGRLRQNVDLAAIGMPGCTLLVSSDFPAFPLSLTPPTGSLTIPIPATPQLVGVTLETQAAVVAPGVTQLGVQASNRGTLRIGNTRPVIVLAQGADNQNDDDTDGFWKVVNATALDIVSVRFDWTQSTVPNAIYFDTNEIGMADRFDGGNSQTPLCRGTYRNGSDFAAGLDYPSSGVTPCGGTARTGWTGSNLYQAAGNYRTLDFRFTSFHPGQTFEFDADTDGGPGNGGAMAGMVVTVRLSDGSQRTGQLVMIDNLTSRVDL